MGMDTVELIWKIEHRFDIRIPNEEASQITTVQDIYDVVSKNLSANGHSLDGLQSIVNQIIAEMAGLELEDIQPHKSITNDLGLD